jgi:hypothetical protein
MSSENAQYHTEMQKKIWKVIGSLLGMSKAIMNGVGTVKTVKPAHCEGESTRELNQRIILT